MPALIDRRHMIALLGGVGFLGGCAGGSGSTGLANATSTGSAEAGGQKPELPAVKVALLLPLTAAVHTAVLGKAMQQAAELALFENSTSGLQLIVKDDKGTPEGAREAAEAAIAAGAELIAGPLFSKSVAAAAPVAKAAHVPVIAFSNDQNVAGGNVYLLTFLPGTEVVRAVQYASSQGRRRFAALIPDDAQGKLIEPVFRSAVEQSGGAVVTLEHYPVNSNAMMEPVQRAREAIVAAEQSGLPVDALFLPGGQDTLPQIASALPHLGVDTRSVKLIGTSGWDYPNSGRDARLLGAWFAAPDPRGWRDFSAKFAKTYGNMPPRLASLAYDAVGVAATFATQPKDSRFTRTNLVRASGFTGADGVFRFGSNGLVDRSLAVLELQKFGPVVVDAASTTPLGAQASAEIQPRAGIN